MPYLIKKQGDKYCVVKKDGGKTIACHKTKADAKKQIAAIYANEKK